VLLIAALLPVTLSSLFCRLSAY